ncbi:hypothetical protein DPMN_147347 [Dreissena polymorpha]|uniref:Nuclease HARBI1 n=1 Tax=Dreissena polymorpha TaxID=45954 RepID=A0A9D4F7P8_DREPO|nr:hypothetical protein DPMN_147347 [Dreissena polymorpha]
MSILPQRPDTVESIVLACVCLHNIIKVGYPGDQNIHLDQEDDAHEVITVVWRNGFLMDSLQVPRGGNLATIRAKQEIEALLATLLQLYWIC